MVKQYHKNELAQTVPEFHRVEHKKIIISVGVIKLFGISLQSNKSEDGLACTLQSYP